MSHLAFYLVLSFFTSDGAHGKFKYMEMPSLAACETWRDKAAEKARHTLPRFSASCVTTHTAPGFGQRDDYLNIPAVKQTPEDAED